MNSAEEQPLLPHHAPPVMRPFLPFPFVITLILPFWLLPYLLSRDEPVAKARSKGFKLITGRSNDTLHLLSLNTFERPRLIGWNDYKDERLSDLVEPLLRHDLLCLQELFWTSGRRKRFINKLSNELPYAAHAPRPTLGSWFQFPPKPIDAGLAVISKRRIVKSSFHMFSASAWNSVDYFVAKGVLYTRLEVLDGFVHVFTTHMQAGDHRDVRERQIMEMVKYIKLVTEDDNEGVVIVAGDLNVNGRGGYSDDSDSEDYREMMNIFAEMGVRDVIRDELGQVVTTAGGLWGHTQKNERIDYILLRRGNGGLVAKVPKGGVAVEELLVEGKPYRTMSDHYAVTAEVAMGRA